MLNLCWFFCIDC